MQIFFIYLMKPMEPDEVVSSEYVYDNVMADMLYKLIISNAYPQEPT